MSNEERLDEVIAQGVAELAKLRAEIEALKARVAIAEARQGAQEAPAPRSRSRSPWDRGYWAGINPPWTGEDRFIQLASVDQATGSPNLRAREVMA